ncbi:FAD-dependent oxidoreductase [Streptomyces sp. NPDC054861]
MNRRRAIVVGAGIGGLTTALALHSKGWDVLVLERAPAQPATGAGIVLAPNALRALRAIGFDPAAAAGSAVPAAMGMRKPNGSWLRRADTDALTARYGSPPLAVHRAALVAGLADELPPGALLYGTAVTEVRATASGLPCVVTDAGEVVADVVIAADGIHSSLRKRYFPHHAGLHYSGETAWRSVVSGEGLPGLTTSETWGRGERFGIVPLADGRVYVFATAFLPEGTRPAEPLGFLWDRFHAWHSPIPELLRRVDGERLLQHDLYDLAEPLPRLHHGRLAWIGDAAHAMTPNLGQGGCQAIEDAVAVGRRLDEAGADGIEEALVAYSADRLARTNDIRLRSRRAGVVAGLRNPVAAAARDLALRLVPTGVSLRALDDLYVEVPACAPR